MAWNYNGQCSGFQEKLWSGEGDRDSLPMQPCLFQGCQVYSTGFFVKVSPLSIASSHGNVLRKTYVTDLSAPFIMQVSPFKAVLESLIPNVDILAT